MLTYQDLKTIQEGHRRNEDVMVLLREIKRLRELAAFSYSVLGYMPLDGLGADGIQAIMPVLAALEAEPAVKEYKLMRTKTENLEFRRQQQLQKNAPPIEKS